GYRGHPQVEEPPGVPQNADAAPAGGSTTGSQAPASQGPGNADERNAVRLADLISIKDAFAKYVEQGGTYPGTSVNLQTLCTYTTIDVGCRLKQVGFEIPVDPRGANFGYFYASDGQSYTLVSLWEGSGTAPGVFA